MKMIGYGEYRPFEGSPYLYARFRRPDGTTFDLELTSQQIVQIVDATSDRDASPASDQYYEEDPPYAPMFDDDDEYAPSGATLRLADVGFGEPDDEEDL